MSKKCFGDDSSVLAHEFGHYLNLIHIWGDYNTGEGVCHSESECYSKGDKICDTGTTDARTGNVGSACTAQSSCGSDDPIRNFMDYTGPQLPCVDQFTEEQARRMRCTIATYR